MAGTDAESVGLRWSWRERVVALVLLAICCAATVVGIQTVTASMEASRDHSTREDVSSTARKAATLLVSIHQATVKEELAELAKLSTGDLAEQLVASTAEQVNVVQKLGLDMDGAVTGIGVQSVGEAVSSVIVAVRGRVVRTSANGSKADAADQFYRLSMELTRVSGSWKVAKLEFVG